MGNIEKRIKRLEDYAPTRPDKYIALLLKLRGSKFKLRFGLGNDASEEEVEAALRRMSSDSKL